MSHRHGRGYGPRAGSRQIDEGRRVALETIETRIPWPRGRFWRPGEPITLELEGTLVTGRLRGVLRDTDPASAYATVTLEPIRASGADQAPRSALG